MRCTQADGTSCLWDDRKTPFDAPQQCVCTHHGRLRTSYRSILFGDLLKFIHGEAGFGREGEKYVSTFHKNPNADTNWVLGLTQTYDRTLWETRRSRPHSHVFKTVIHDARASFSAQSHSKELWQHLTDSNSVKKYMFVFARIFLWWNEMALWLQCLCPWLNAGRSTAALRSPAGHWAAHLGSNEPVR